MQRHLARLRAPAGGAGVRRQAAREDESTEDWRSTERDIFFGPVINAESVAKFERAVAQAKQEGEIVLGGAGSPGSGSTAAIFVAPTIARLPLESALFAKSCSCRSWRSVRSQGWSTRSPKRTRRIMD